MAINKTSSVKSLFQIALFLLILISFISAEPVWVKYDIEKGHGEEKKEPTDLNKVKVFALNLQSASSLRPLDYYVKVTVTPTNNSPTPVLCFSPTDANCENNKQVIARVTDGSPAILLLKREQFIDDSEELYVQVKCQDDNCGYTIEFDGEQTAQINANITYSYLVTSKNKDMTFEVLGDADEGSFLTIAIEGSTSAKLQIDNVDKSVYDFGTGKIITFPLIIEQNSGVLAIFQIRGAAEGDYITLNVHKVYERAAPDNMLYPNGPVVMGMLDVKEGYYREECFPISAIETEKYKVINKYYLSVRIYTKYALFWLADERDSYMEDVEEEITDGYLAYLIETNGKKRSVCFEFSYLDYVEKTEVVYSLSLLEPITLEPIYNFYPPQTMNQIYRRILPKGVYATYYGAKSQKSDKKYDFNIYNRKGVTEMYVTQCSSYPECPFSENDLSEMIRPKRLSRMTIHDAEIFMDSTALDSDRDIMIIYCKDDDNENKGYCEFESSVTTQGSEVTLVEDEQFSRFALKEEKGSFKIFLNNAIKIQSLTIDIMIFSGDVTFNAQNPVKSSNNDKLGEDVVFYSQKYYLSNKIFYHYNFAKTAINSLKIEYKAELNSFFTIKYNINHEDLIQKEENIISSESYLVEIDPTTSEKSKKIFLQNFRYKKEKHFLANFFSLNCDFQVMRGENEIPFFDGYAQEIFNKDTQGYKSNNYEYNIKVTKAELSNYNHKMCMLYVAGYESEDAEYITEIVIGENINQQVILDNDFRDVRFLYPEADAEKDLALYINVIDKAYYNVKIYINTEEYPIRDYTVTRSQIYYIPATELMNYCEKDTLCNIIVDTNFTFPIDGMNNRKDYMIEVTVRQIKNTPTYLQKNQAKKDFTCGDLYYYFYTDVGKNDVGEVCVNFLRDFGNVWGKIVRKDQSTADEEANWRGIYRMPSQDWEDSFLYNNYTKKIKIDVENTQDCIEGCYLLLSIQISQIGEYAPDSKFYPFTIITTFTTSNQAYTDTPRVVIQVNEYIIGNVDVSQNERISQFYEVWLPGDSYRVEFDWQSSVAGLYINVGGTALPTTKNADFKLLPPGRDSLLYLEKYQIIQKAKSKKIYIPNEDSLQDLNLIIGVWTDKTDSVDTEIFSLRLHQPNDQDDLEIVEINSDQKVICSPKYFNDDQYRCLFVITYDDEDENINMPLIIHATSVNQSAITHIYGNFIDRQFYDEYDKAELRKNTPTSQSAQYSTLQDDINYIYTILVPGRTRNYFFINVVSDKSDDIMVMNSMPLYNILNSNNYEFYPNPSTEQVLAISIDQLRLKFTSFSLLINLETLDGEADITWENAEDTVYYLRGKGDRLILTSGSESDIKSNTIIIKRRNPEVNKNFIFYISYYHRDSEYNYDQVSYGKSVEISYKNTRFPVYLYSKVGENYNDINIAVTFRDSVYQEKGEYSIPPLYIRATIAKESTIYKSKQDPELGPNIGKIVTGAYDPAIKTAQVFLNSSIINNFNIKPEDNPTLYLAIEKSEGIDPKIYTTFNVETQIIKINTGIVPVEKNYNYARFSGSYYNYYRLKVNRKLPYMMIEIAFNSEYLDFSITEREDRIRSNNTNLLKKAVKEKGKIILTINNPTEREFVYLNIFKKEINQQYDNLLYNYVFKYLNVKKEEDFVNYKILDNNNILNIDEKQDENITTIECKFNKIDLGDVQANITYFFKVVENSTLHYGESYETIAVTESPYYTVFERNPKDEKGKITLTAKGALSNWCYLEVIAQIQQDTILEYVSYKGIANIRPSPKKKDEDKDDGGDSSDGGSTGKKGNSVTVFIVVVVILVALAVGLGIIVFIIQRNNKSLINQVKHISFQQNQNAGNADPDLLLKKNDA